MRGGIKLERKVLTQRELRRAERRRERLWKIISPVTNEPMTGASKRLLRCFSYDSAAWCSLFLRAHALHCLLPSPSFPVLALDYRSALSVLITDYCDCNETQLSLRAIGLKLFTSPILPSLLGDWLIAAKDRATELSELEFVLIYGAFERCVRLGAAAGAEEND